MASRLDKGKKKNPRASEWSKSGSFMHKPERGWIHPDAQLTKDAGVCYGVRYIGCIEVKESMRQLDFDTRTALAREAISRVCEAAGLKTAKKRKADKKLAKMLGERPIMQYAGSNVNLTITIECLNLMIMESGEIIATHQMPGISFASGGDAETLDFVSYVAKDSANGRACHVLECGGGLAEDVITTIGQAFELRFKEYLKNQPKAVEIADSRIEGPIADADAWGEDENEYYNDRPGARPPNNPPPQPLTEYATPKSNLPVSDGLYTSVKDPPTYDTPRDQPLIDLSDNNANIYDNKEGVGKIDFQPNLYDNKENVMAEPLPPSSQPTSVDPFNMEGVGKIDFQPILYDNKENETAEPLPPSSQPTTLDPFNMDPFTAGLPHNGQQNGFYDNDLDKDVHVQSNPEPEPPQLNIETKQEEPKNIAPVFEEWYHGALPRKQAEKLLQRDGDFLVRKSSTDPSQFVLSGRQGGSIKHLLLVDPDGVVRTKDHTFESVPHLIKYHRSQNLPIISQESELHLIRPVSNNYTNC